MSNQAAKVKMNEFIHILCIFQKILLIFDLNQTLFFATKSSKASFERIDALKTKKPNDTLNNIKLYYREGRNEFLDNLFRKVDNTIIQK